MTKKKKKMTRAQMRVQIAKDVVAQIKASRIVPKHGIYLEDLGNGSFNLVGRSVRREFSGQLSELTKKVKNCSACALGAAALVAVDRFNALEATNYAAHDIINGHRPDEYLLRFFSTEVLQRIEDAFESGDFGYSCIPYEKPAERMIAIWTSVIANRGVFRSMPLKERKLMLKKYESESLYVY